jgi:hypothetical protein
LGAIGSNEEYHYETRKAEISRRAYHMRE